MSDMSVNPSVTSIASTPASPVYIPSTPSPEPLPVPPPRSMFNDLQWALQPLSPNTALVVLELNEQGIPNFTLTCNIAKGLAETIKTREGEELRLKDRIRGLEDRVLHYEENFSTPPDGYVENLYYPNLVIPIGNGIFRPAKWIKLLEEGRVAMYASDDGPSSPPTIGLIHAQPNTDTTLTVEPLPAWYKALLMGPATAFHTYRRTLSHPQQWGTRADVTHFRAIDEEIVKASSRLRAIEVEIEDLQLSRSLIQARLEMACAAQQAEGLEPLALGRHVTFCGGAWKKTRKVDDRGRST